MLSDAHKRKSKYNLEVYNYLSANSYYDWEVITLFYSALHLVDAYLLKNVDVKPNTHFERSKYIKRYLKDIDRQYKELFYLSLRARYSPKNIPKQLSRKAYELYEEVREYLYKRLDEYDNP